ncbi:hypothetical protein COU57_03610 [Candidatus Pacearchaeota archaeon CG10_big_fil_rev_8_21_14_0_10_32_14]|nr:MAG: hypothetical protein COU57_03610 [Candidatus Pacearchaeota archaeon CG10_big_fil_rev_8_21_14_0_10_32_14]
MSHALAMPVSGKECFGIPFDWSGFDPDALERFFGENFIPQNKNVPRPFLLMAGELHWHIHFYVPTQFGYKWTGPISNFEFLPDINEDIALRLYVAYTLGELESEVKEIDDRHIQSWFVLEAIKDFFQSGKHTKFVDELKRAA